MYFRKQLGGYMKFALRIASYDDGYRVMRKELGTDIEEESVLDFPITNFIEILKWLKEVEKSIDPRMFHMKEKTMKNDSYIVIYETTDMKVFNV